MNIVLIGYRGSGKSSVGRAVATATQRGFIDTDTLIIQEAGKTIREIFAAEGEAGFRDRETRAIKAAAMRHDVVIAVGGGAVLREENVVEMQTRARVVWLRAPAETLHERIEADAASNSTRPNLTAGGGVEEVRKMLAVRLPLYAAAAHHEVDVEGLTVEQAAARVIAAIERGATC